MAPNFTKLVDAGNLLLPDLAVVFTLEVHGLMSVYRHYTI